jgi:4-amino-4-deoxy-L-arabinose transferase-like glycosyltransferase
MPSGQFNFIPPVSGKKLAFLSGLTMIISVAGALLFKKRRSVLPSDKSPASISNSTSIESISPDVKENVSATSGRRWALLAAFGFMIFSAYGLRTEADTTSIILGTLCFLTGIVFLWCSRTNPIVSDVFDSAEADTPIRIVPVLIGCVVLIYLTRVNAVPDLIRTDVSIHAQFALFVSAILLLAWGPVRWRVLWPLFDRREGILILSVTLVALIIRLWALGDAVSTPLSDEYTFAQVSMNFRVDARYPLLQPFDAGYAFPWLYPYLIYGSLSLFGSTVASLRIPSAIFGVLTIPALYLLGKYLFNRRIGLLAALLLATFPPHVHLSRIALNNVADPFFGVLALGFIARGLQSKRLSDFALGGLTLGMTQYFYEGGRLVFPMLVLLWLITNVFPQRRFEPRQLALGLFMALTLALPIYITLNAIGYSPTPRLDMVAPSPERFAFIEENTQDRNVLPESYMERLVGVLLFFVHTLDNSPEFYGGPQPMILTSVVPVFLLGLGYAILKWRHPGIRLLLIWLGGMILGLSLIRIGAWTARYVPVFPVIALLMALAIEYVLGGALASEKYRGKVVFGLTFVICVGQIIYYFGPHLEMYNLQARSWRDYADAYHRAIEYPPDTVVVFVTDDSVWIPYLNILKNLWETDLPIAYFPIQAFTYETLMLMDTHLNYLFFFNREDLATPGLVRLEFELEGPYFSPYNVPDEKEFAMYFAPASSS